MRKVVFEGVQDMTLENIVAFQQEWIKDRPTDYCILSDIKALDLELSFKVRHSSEIVTGRYFWVLNFAEENGPFIDKNADYIDKTRARINSP